jgi:hypothetical protein
VRLEAEGERAAVDGLALAVDANIAYDERGVLCRGHACHKGRKIPPHRLVVAIRKQRARRLRVVDGKGLLIVL